MSTTTFSPAEGLPTGERIHPGLVIPFGERVDDAHEGPRAGVRLGRCQGSNA